jgi:hypothetical protein
LNGLTSKGRGIWAACSPHPRLDSSGSVATPFKHKN